MRHIGWDELDVPVRRAIEARTGSVRASRKATAGLNSQLALILDADAGTVFVKGLPFKQRLAVDACGWARHRLGEGSAISVT